jgi:hypothetical protein
LLYVIVKFCCTGDKGATNRCLRKFEKKLGADLFWNTWIRFMLASYIEIVFAVLLNFTETVWVSWGCYYSNFTFYSFVPVALLAPFWVGLYCFFKYDELSFYYIKRVYGTAYDDIEVYDHRNASFKPFLFLFHR